MTVVSKINQIIYVRPIGLWFFVNFIAACACSANSQDKHDSYHFQTFFIFLLISTILTFIIALFYILSKKEFSIDDEKIIYRNKFFKTESTYILADIIDFDWNGKPITTRNRYGSNVRLNNDYFMITFKNQTTLTILNEQYANFIEIRSIVYDYCIKNNIIEIRPLEERKHSRFKR